MLAYGSLGLLWPFAAMHQRDVLAAGGGTLSDTMHVALGGVTVLLMFLAIAVGATAFGKRFRVYSVASIVVLVAFGALTFWEAPRLEANLPTPWIGLWERINISVFLLWVVVLATCCCSAVRIATGHAETIRCASTTWTGRRCGILRWSARIVHRSSPAGIRRERRGSAIALGHNMSAQKLQPRVATESLPTGPHTTDRVSELAEVPITSVVATRRSGKRLLKTCAICERGDVHLGYPPRRDGVRSVGRRSAMKPPGSPGSGTRCPGHSATKVGGDARSSSRSSSCFTTGESTSRDRRGAARITRQLSAGVSLQDRTSLAMV